MPIGTAVILGSICAIAATIALFILVIPESKKETIANNKFLLFLHDLFNFKTLYLEWIVKALYVLTTTACVGIGFFMLFAGYRGYISYAGPGFVLMILGPIIARITYESTMYIILLVKNTMQINGKLGKKEPEAAPAPAEENKD